MTHSNMKTLRIELGRTRMARDEAGRLQPEALVALDAAADQPMDLWADGRLVARGEPLTLDGRLGVRVVEVVSSSHLPPGDG